MSYTACTDTELFALFDKAVAHLALVKHEDAKRCIRTTIRLIAEEQNRRQNFSTKS